MMNEEGISERNGYLIALISELNLGLHIIDLPHKPRILSKDGKSLLRCYVHNFTFHLKGANEDSYYQLKLKPIERINIDEVRNAFNEWIEMFEHTEIFTISIKDSGLFVTGFNHHNKILKKNPYPVFARYDPLFYYDVKRAESILEKFTDYNLIINQ
jgi:hypothetical protein